ncbi:hypothetical protein PLESTB_001103200 [Pleodorina starrii]|uniref:Uncharacterized protein n=1 Tax=Pleodorina starrii TaxID=330485 RepID=A0A9W6BQQ3_9CHLO|nr:hypothetical protein PLESTM_001338100 [Pleodorina starrii]GLC56423.1 hypothetical protein PLESTB_001103200 [Pleodorina starrii]GLC68923.1 hypothetical protein PLESTF_000759400 [Pleodorina starrii]
MRVDACVLPSDAVTRAPVPLRTEDGVIGGVGSGAERQCRADIHRYTYMQVQEEGGGGGGGGGDWSARGVWQSMLLALPANSAGVVGMRHVVMSTSRVAVSRPRARG